jgi:hypothetical protein
VDARGEAGMVGHTLEQTDELEPLRRVERAEDPLVVRVGDGRGLIQQPARRRGQMDRMGATVTGVPPPLDEPADLEIIDEADHRVPMDRHQIGELLLRETVRRSKMGEQTKVPRLETERGKAGGEQLGRMRADLREQEPRTLGQGLRAGPRHGTNYPLQ